MTGPGYGSITFRADHELVGRVIAEKLRRKASQRGDCDGVRVVGKKEGVA